MKINLIIATYSGIYNKYSSNPHKKNYLKYTLSLLNNVKTNIDQITIMKPLVNKEHFEIPDYYCFDSIDLCNISNKIKIIECENIGISYGQYFEAVSKNMDFDYHIFIEDDYVPFKDYFENDLISELNKCEESSLLCLFYYKNKTYNMLNYLIQHGESTECYNSLKNKLEKYDLEKYYAIPDFAIGIFSKETINKILSKFETFDNIKDLFNFPFYNIWVHQVLFGYLLGICDILINDLSKNYMNIFYDSLYNSISLCNFDNYVSNWKEKPYLNEKFEIPLH